MSYLLQNKKQIYYLIMLKKTIISMAKHTLVLHVCSVDHDSSTTNTLTLDTWYLSCSTSTSNASYECNYMTNDLTL